MNNDPIKAFLTVPNFEDFIARPTFGYFQRVIEREKAELEGLRSTLSAFGYAT